MNNSDAATMYTYAIIYEQQMTHLFLHAHYHTQSNKIFVIIYLSTFQDRLPLWPYSIVGPSGCPSGPFL